MIMDNAVEILLVEDNPYDAEMTVDALKKNNLANRLHIARDGAEALDYLFGPCGTLRSDTPKVILLDLKLPKVSGLEVLQRIKADEQARTIPVVVLTSSNQDSDLRECYRLGVNSYITKPVEFESFLNAISALGFYWLLLNKLPE